MSKRGATSELNQDNWQVDDEPEEKGSFAKASEADMAIRPIKKARRRTDMMTSPNEKPSVFSNFSGFAAKSDSSIKPLFNLGSNTSGFSFGNTSVESSKLKEDSPKVINGNSKVDTKGKVNGTSANEENSKTNDLNPVYLANLKALNLGVIKWVKDHVEKNPYVNLEPVFKDYQKHFKELKDKHQVTASVDSKKTNSEPVSIAKSNTEKSIPSNTFSFGSSSFNKSMEKKEEKEHKEESVTKILGSTQSTPLFSFGNDSKSSFSFGNTQSSASSKPFSFSNSNNSSASGFTFGNSVNSTETKSSGFTFGGTPSTTSATTTLASKTETEQGSGEQEPSDEPPKVEEVEVKEDDAFFEKKVKLYYKKGDQYVDKGVGMLFLKKVGDKTQLIIRNLTKLGTILLNIVLGSSLPTNRLGKKDVLLVCVPNPPINKTNEPVSMLIRVKTPEDADELFEKINENKK